MARKRANGPALAARSGTTTVLWSGISSESEVLEVGPDGQSVTPAGEATGRAVGREVVGRRVQAWLRHADVDQADGDRVVRDRTHVVGLHGAAAHAVVAAFGTLVGCVTFTRIARARVVLRSMPDLVRPAEEGAGEQEAGQEHHHERTHGKITLTRRSYQFNTIARTAAWSILTFRDGSDDRDLC